MAKENSHALKKIDLKGYYVNIDKHACLLIFSTITYIKLFSNASLE